MQPKPGQTVITSVGNIVRIISTDGDNVTFRRIGVMRNDREAYFTSDDWWGVVAWPMGAFRDALPALFPPCEYCESAPATGYVRAYDAHVCEPCYDDHHGPN